MDWLEPVINLLLLLTALSVAAERITNILKLRSAKLREEATSTSMEKDRERAILLRSLVVGVVLAVLLKADLLAALQRPDAPWATLGWIQAHGTMWILAPEARSVPTAAYALLGSVVTGAALGFGSKFWHEILDALLELRNMAKLRNRGATAAIDQARTGARHELPERQPAGTDS